MRLILVLENLDANGLGRVLLPCAGEKKGYWQGGVRSVRISQVVRVRMVCERSRVRRRPMIPCSQRSSDAEPTVKALFRRGLLDV